MRGDGVKRYEMNRECVGRREWGEINA